MRTKRRDLKEQRQGRKPEPAPLQLAGSGQPRRLDGYCYEFIKMIAGAGMSLTGGGAGMLRARRRDISIKPNRKLDRKSSRGMIYENEELRLRTIHINAEVEQGQNDIKKLRRENEQLRREIWSLRDEYDKLEEILKKQKSREESDEPEDRSENEAAGSEYSDEEEEEEDDEEDGSSSEDEDPNQEEKLENAENQKISSEKLINNNNNVSPIRACGTLPVLAEEEELKKEKKESLTSEQLPVIPETQQNQFLPYQTSTPLVTAATSFGNYQTDCPFVFPEPNCSNGGCNLMSCAQLYSTPPLNASFEASQVPPPPAGWQSFPTTQLESGSATVASSPQLGSSLADRRRAFFRQHADSYNVNTGPLEVEVSEVSRDTDAKSRLAASMDETAGEGKLRHFFAPLKSRSPFRSVDDSARSHSDNSPSSEKTGSTVVSRERYNCDKGSADICVNGAVSCSNIETGDAKAFFSSENLLVVSEARANVSSNEPSSQLTKSLSCQDLSSRLSFTEGNFKSVSNAKSDNTLDNISICSRGYRSQLNVTLRPPRKTPSPDTPEIPKLPAIDYKLFNNPFLQNFEQAYQNFPVRTEGPSPVTHPLSIQVCESPTTSYSSPVRVQPSFSGPSMDADCGTCKRKDLDRLRLMIPPKTKSGEAYHVTSFETPSPQTLQIPPMTPYELDALRRMPTITSPVPQTPNNSRLYQNVPFVPRGAEAYNSQRMYYDTMKVPAQTQTSPEDATTVTAAAATVTQPEGEAKVESQPTPDAQKKRRSRKDKTGSVKEKRRSSQKLKKQTSISLRNEVIENVKSRDDDKNESRSSSSGQESPRKEQTKRVSLYLSTKKRPSLSSTRTSRSRSIERSRAEALIEANNSERERTNSTSSRDAAIRQKSRKNSTSSGSVPWCACWGNGCI